METLPITNNPQDILTLAISQGASIETLEKLMALQERYQANKARSAFFKALSEFQRKCPVMLKDKSVLVEGKLRYKFVTLSKIVDTIKDPLWECGLTYRWEIKDQGNKLEVTCIITHREGHSEFTTMSADADASGGKNGIQARGSAIAYLERYTLTGALGISSTDTDMDGHGTDKSVDEWHREFMEHLNPLIQKDSKTWSKYHPDNWKGERNSTNYKKAMEDLKTKTNGISR